jgi:hypothetical protein
MTLQEKIDSRETELQRAYDLACDDVLTLEYERIELEEKLTDNSSKRQQKYNMIKRCKEAAEEMGYAHVL